MEKQYSNPVNSTSSEKVQKEIDRSQLKIRKTETENKARIIF